MKIKHLIVVTMFTVGVSMTAGVLAEETDFVKLDADGDGFISMTEADKDAKLVESWEAIDVNQDGMVERAEFSVFEEKMAEPAK